MSLNSVAVGTAAVGAAAVGAAALHRSLAPAAWSEAAPPLLRDPRALVVDLHRVHRPSPGTVVLGVLDAEGRVVAGASFGSGQTGGGAGPGSRSEPRSGSVDGWLYRNALLDQLRRIIPHDLRRSSPVRTAVLMLCRRGAPDWTDEDGAWMWALQDASVLHGLRCGAYVTLTDAGWQVLGDGRRGRCPNADSWAQETVRTVSTLPVGARPVRALAEPVRAALTGTDTRPARAGGLRAR